MITAISWGCWWTIDLKASAHSNVAGITCLLDFGRISREEEEKWPHLHGYHFLLSKGEMPSATNEIFLQVLLGSLPSGCFHAVLPRLCGLKGSLSSQAMLQ